MQRIAVIGGTGMTGQCVVDYALQKKYSVRLLYRSESTVPGRFRGNVDLVKGDATNLEDCKNVLQGVEAACIILGTRNKLEKTEEMSKGTANLITAMKDLGIRRFSIVLSSFLFRPVNEVPAMFQFLNEEHQRMLDLTKQSGLEYIAILPPHIADEPAGPYSILHDTTPGRKISKLDLAAFIVDSLSQPQHFGKVCGIASAE